MLASRARMSHQDVLSFEHGRRVGSGVVEGIQLTLTKSGVRFVDEGGAGRGVVIGHSGDHLVERPEGGGIEPILLEIERCLSADLYFPAIALALTIPDVCSSLQTQPGTRVSFGVRYAAWYDAHVGEAFSALTGADCWSLRCGVSHSGKLLERGAEYERVGFALPHPMAATFVGCIFQGMLVTDAASFCRVLISAAGRWFEANASDPIVQSNLPALFSYRPNGMAPYIHGIPIIA
jgi:hypothetical protein